MKSCPTCSRTYSDNTITFCLVDGAVLSAPYDPQSTAGTPQSRQTNPHTAQTESYDSHRGSPTIQSPGPHVSYQPNYGQQSWASAPPPPRRRSYVWLLALAAIFLIVFGAGLAIVVSQMGLFGGSNSSTGLKEKETAGSNSNNSNNTSNDNSSSANTSSATTSTPLPASTPEATPVPSLNIVGTWTGTYTKDPGTLIISSQNGDTVSGTLNTGGYLIAVSGSVNPTTRAVVLRETSVIKKMTAQYANWTLGVNSGTVSSDGKSMSGKGKAKGQAGYSWSFSRK